MPGKTVYAYVVADLLHIGHVNFLENAKAIAGEEGKLIVGVLTDEATMEKKSKPTLSFNERIKLVKALKCVDLVVAQETYSPILNIMNIKPDILIESDSHDKKDLEEAKKIADEIKCELLIIPYYSEQSSSKIKDSIIKTWQELNNQKKDKTQKMKGGKEII